jgi:two-component system, sensor histidine kinase and response regulator
MERENPMAEVFNRQSLLQRVDGDEELLVEMVTIFLEYTPQQLQEMRQALDLGDARGLQGKAHSVKGAAASISAEAMHQAAGALELAGRNCDLEQAALHFQTLNQEFSRFQAALAQ